MIEITPDDTPEGQDPGHAVLLLRRHRYTGTVSSYLCWTPDPVPLARLIKVTVTRWKTEEDHQLSKQVSGLDSGQVTTWTSWHRRTAISLLACAFPAVAAAWQRAAGSSAGMLDLIPVTEPELPRQLRGTVIPEPRRDKPHRDARALWRRRHHYGAQQTPPAMACLRRRDATVTIYNCVTEVVAALTDDKVRDLALRAAGLSDRSLRAIADMVDSARAVEGLPVAASAEGTGPRRTRSTSDTAG
jgi:hypothetical protein